MGKTENEEKKKFLWSYRDSVRRLERISAEIEEPTRGDTGHENGGVCRNWRDWPQGMEE